MMSFVSSAGIYAEKLGPMMIQAGMARSGHQVVPNALIMANPTRKGSSTQPIPSAP